MSKRKIFTQDKTHIRRQRPELTTWAKFQRRLKTIEEFSPAIVALTGKTKRLDEGLAYLCSVLFAGQDITGDDRVVMGHLRPHNQYLTYICWVRYDRAWAKCSVALVMSTSP